MGPAFTRAGVFEWKLLLVLDVLKGRCRRHWMFIGLCSRVETDIGRMVAMLRIEYAINRYSMETKRLLDVLDKHLGEGNKQYVCGDQ